MIKLHSQMLIALPAVALLILPAPSAQGQEVQWRYDYQAAKQEAKDKNRPMVLELGTSSCIWCRRLETSTFRDPGIVAQLNAQFVPIKMDAEQERWLVQALQVHRYPTLVFAAPDGRILECHEGFMDATRFNRQLESSLKESTPATAVQQTAQESRLAPQFGGGRP